MSAVWTSQVQPIRPLRPAALTGSSLCRCGVERLDARPLPGPVWQLRLSGALGDRVDEPLDELLEDPFEPAVDGVTGEVTGMLDGDEPGERPGADGSARRPDLIAAPATSSALQALVEDIAASAPLLVDLTDAVLVRPRAISDLLDRATDERDALYGRLAVVCPRLTGRTLLRNACRAAPLPVFASAGDALQALVMASEGIGAGWQAQPRGRHRRPRYLRAI